jgi:hypothetical protein
MKPIVLYLQKQNLIIGIVVALVLVFFLKHNHNNNNNATAIESFLSLRELSSLCNRNYTPRVESVGITTKTNPTVTSIKQSTRSNEIESKPYIKPINTLNENKKPQCIFGIDVNPPSSSVKEALDTLTPINNSDVITLEETFAKMPEFTNLLNSPVKNEVIKGLIILNTLLTRPPDNITEEEIQHIAITILSYVNMVDPQIASFASTHYSNTDQSPDTNPFTNLDIPKPDLNLDVDSIKIITSEKHQELSPEAIDQITGVLDRIKIFMPYDECTAILSRNI